MPIDSSTKSKKVIRREIQKILHEKAVEGPVRAKIINSLVNYTYNSVRIAPKEGRKPTHTEEFK